MDRSYSNVALVGALRWAGHRLLVEYDHRRNPLGRARDGRPTTLADDALTVRAEVSF
jgi:hypothetical protein